MELVGPFARGQDSGAGPASPSGTAAASAHSALSNPGNLFALQERKVAGDSLVAGRIQQE